MEFSRIFYAVRYENLEEKDVRNGPEERHRFHHPCPPFPAILFLS
jgi:hypothetical protein